MPKLHGIVNPPGERVPAWIIEAVSTAADLDAILAVEQASFANPWTRDMYLAELQHPEVSFLYVARGRQRQIVGFCAFWRVHDELHINNLAVDPAYRREGVASALLTAILRDGMRTGAHRATLEVRRSNDVARQLYERFGFTVAGVRHGYYTHPDEDALVLWREVEPPRRS